MIEANDHIVPVIDTTQKGRRDSQNEKGDGEIESWLAGKSNIHKLEPAENPIVVSARRMIKKVFRK